jgi:hypothetical protein
MNHYFLRAAGVALLPLSLAACTAPAPHTERIIGRSLTDMKNAQVLNPGADRNMAAPMGMSASTAKLGYDQYQKSFKAPEKGNNTFVIGLGR